MKMIRNKFLRPLSSSVALLCLCGSVYALPVYDGMNYYLNQMQVTQQRLTNLNMMNQVKNTLVQIQQQRLQLEQLRATYVQLKALKDNMSGENLYGGLMQGNNLMRKEEYMPKTMDAAQDNWRNGRGDTAQYTTDYQVRYPNQAYKGAPNTEQARAYNDDVNATMGLDATAKSVYAKIDKRTKAIALLTEQINKATTTKQALDLNNSLLSELAGMMADDLRLRTLQAHKTATENQRVLTEAGKEQQRTRAKTPVPANATANTATNVPYNPYK